MKIIPFQDFIRRYFSGESFVAFDTETSGLNTFHDDIIEIAGAIFQRGQKPVFFQELMNVNTNKISAEAWQIHKIPKEEILKARSPKEVLSDFIAFANNRSLVAHNIKFDFDILNSNLIRHGMKPYQTDEVACTQAYAKDLMQPSYLAGLIAHYKIPYDKNKHHRATYDVEMLLSVIDKMAKEHEPNEMQYSLIL
jgi:DNA polymerase III alpha subunit (gram-positive type)